MSSSNFSPATSRIGFGDVIATVVFFVVAIAVIFVTDFSADSDDPENCAAVVEIDDEASAELALFGVQ